VAGHIEVATHFECVARVHALVLLNVFLILMTEEIDPLRGSFTLHFAGCVPLTSE